MLHFCRNRNRHRSIEERLKLKSHFSLGVIALQRVDGFLWQQLEADHSIRV